MTMKLVTVSLFSLLLTQVVTGGSFRLLAEDGSATMSGLLIADHVGKTDKVGVVCDDQFDSIAASVICREMGFNTALGWWNTPSISWEIQRDYTYVLDDIQCFYADRSFNACSYVMFNDCAPWTEQVFLECACEDNTFIKSDYGGCAECPEGAHQSDTDPMRCTCGPGKQWKNSTCEACPENSYKAHATDSPCLPCPSFSTASTTGSTSCSCPAGFKWSGAECVMCSPGSISQPGSDSCYSCPVGSGPMPGNAACGCAPGLFWNTNNCEFCPPNHYSSRNSFTCTPCPDNTVSLTGSSHCSACPDWHVWRSNYTCQPCSDGMTEEDCQCPAGYTRQGNICTEEITPMKQTGAPKDVTAIILGVVLFVFCVLAILILIKFRYSYRQSKPPTTLAPRVPYSVIRDSDTSDPVFSPIREENEDRIYQELNFPRPNELDEDYVAPDINMDDMYVQSDRGDSNAGEYQEVRDDNVGYSVFCGGAVEENTGGVEDNLYDNI